MTTLVSSVEGAIISAEDQLAREIPKRKRKPILIITVDIGKGKSGDITVFAEDSHKDLAVAFCQEHGVSDTLVGAIEKHIEQNVTALHKAKKKKEVDKRRKQAALAAASTALADADANANAAHTNTNTNTKDTNSSSPPPPPATSNAMPSLPSTAEQEQKISNSSSIGTKKKKRATRKKKKDLATATSMYTTAKDVENSKVAALMGKIAPPESFVSKSEIERRRKAALRKKKEKEEREVRKQKRLERKRQQRIAKKMNSTGTNNTTTNKKKKKKRKKANVYSRLYNHGMEHWEKVDMKTANRMEEVRANAETYTFKPEIHSAPNEDHTSSSSSTLSSSIHTRLYRDGTQSLREKEAETLKREHERKQQQLEECTFRPAINTRSLELIKRKRAAEQHFSTVEVPTKTAVRKKKSTGANITITAQETAADLRNNREGIFDVLYDPPRFTSKVIELAKQQEEKEMAECTFQPEISEKSKRIVSRKRRLTRRQSKSSSSKLSSKSSSSKSSSNNHHKLFQRGPSEYHMSTKITSREEKFNELYQDAQRRREKQDEYYAWQEEQYTFKPDIGVNKIRSHPDHGSSKNFYERMHQSGKMKEKKLYEKRMKHSTIDVNTGQKLFQPKVGRAPNFTRNIHGLPVHDFLFASRHEYNDKKRLLKANDSKKRNDNFNKSHVTSTSVKLINHARRRKSAEIFLALLPLDIDDANIGNNTELDTTKARFDNLSTTTIDQNLRFIVIDMIERLNGAGITYEEFATLLDRELEDTTSGPIMSILVNNKGRSHALETTKLEIEKKDKLNMTFKPKLNKNSIEIANKLGRGESATMPIYDLLHKHQRRYKTNLELQQKRQLAKEMEECTFQPKLMTSKSQFSNSTMYQRLPGAYHSPTKASNNSTRNKVTLASNSYTPPDVWTPSENTPKKSPTNATSTSTGRTGELLCAYFILKHV